jgi:hypothetical protein
MIPKNNLHLKLKNHCECKLELYKKMLNDLFRKSQSKHVSFDGSINLNNNNSSIYNTSSSSSSTPQQYTHEYNQDTRQRKYRRTETHSTSNDNHRK